MPAPTPVTDLLSLEERKQRLILACTLDRLQWELAHRRHRRQGAAALLPTLPFWMRVVAPLLTPLLPRWLRPFVTVARVADRVRSKLGAF